MEIILSNTITSLTGSFGQDYGFAIRRKGSRFFSTRCTNVEIPQDGHLRFIILAAELAQQGMFVSNIVVSGQELLEAAQEAGLTFDSVLPDVTYNAHDVLNLKKYYSL